MNVLITGNSSGLGLGLTEAAIERGWQVYGCSRRGCPVAGVRDLRCDLAELPGIPETLGRLLAGVERLDLVILNAGMLGRIQTMTATSVDELERIMAVNVWANKVILDTLIEMDLPPARLLGISSGAAVLGNKGWSGYALSKASLNMLLRLYARELPNTHVCALAPGLIDSPMMDYLCEEPDPTEFPALARIREARGTAVMPDPRAAAERVLSVLPALTRFPSGEFVDIRQILAPEEYQALMQGRSAPSGR